MTISALPVTRTHLIVIANVVAAIILAVLLLGHHRRPAVVHYEPVDTSAKSGLVSKKWDDCFKSCRYHIVLTNEDGTTKQYDMPKEVYDQVAEGAKIKLKFQASDVNAALVSGVDVLEAAPPPPPPVVEAPAQPVPGPAAQPAQTPAQHHKHKTQ